MLKKYPAAECAVHFGRRAEAVGQGFSTPMVIWILPSLSRIANVLTRTAAGVQSIQHAASLHSLLQIRDDVLGILQPDAEAEEALMVDGGIVG